MDPYKILGVTKDASQGDIKKAFREKALEYHPDKGGNEENFKQINEAYSLISDPEKRSRFDAQRDGIGFNFGSFSSSPFGDIFGDIFGTRKKRQRRPRPITDDDLVFDLRVSLRQIKQGLQQQSF